MKLSLCCISKTLNDKGLRFRTTTFKAFRKLSEDEGVQKLSGIVQHNLMVTRKIVEFCKDRGIAGYRMSSEITPIMTHPDLRLKLTDLPNQDGIQLEIAALSATIKQAQVRVSAHPSEFISLTSLDKDVVERSIYDLEWHAAIFDALSLPCSFESPLNIHCRKDGDVQQISKVFMDNYSKLSDRVKNRLVLEVNDNKNGNWTINNLCRYFYQPHGIPITFDTLHHSLCNDGTSAETAFWMAHETWPTTPIFHYSEGIDGTRSHAEFAEHSPPDHDVDVLWDVELKGKDLAIFKIMEKMNDSRSHGSQAA